ncbi:MAG: acyl-CoA dehydrogenase family protein, partial [Steroidobacteraceae bacterium]
MADYRAPLQQMRFTIEHLAEFRDVAALLAYAAVDADTAEAVLEEAGKFAGSVLAPINWLGDRQGVKVVDRAVQVPAEFTAAYVRFCEGGWPGIAANPDFGGQGLPKAIAIACDEMWSAANVAFALCPELSQGAILALDRHGSDELKAKYLEKLISGEWTGTMCLTEPQAGSDLSTLTSKAEPQPDGSFLLTGRKIYITWGDHDMAANVVHLVLARLPGAPQGTKGISLFLVPKYLVGDDGAPAARNDAYAVSVEHKMGIHASPTCVMAFGDEGGARGWLVGRENEGLAAMFTMMNYMRLGVGAQGVGLADRSYQAAVGYARDRVQGRAPGEKGRVPIIRHPDIRRTLLLMRSLTQASRAICYYTASCLDRGNHGDTPESSAAWLARGDLMTPIAKAFASEIGQEVTELGIQVHGGMGYVEETGVAQYYRDARIAPIYEGTNGIQAMDLVGRKLLRDGGVTVSAFVTDMR